MVLWTANPTPTRLPGSTHLRSASPGTLGMGWTDLSDAATTTTSIGPPDADPTITIPGGPGRGPEYVGDLSELGKLRSTIGALPPADVWARPRGAAGAPAPPHSIDQSPANDTLALNSVDKLATVTLKAVFFDWRGTLVVPPTLEEWVEDALRRTARPLDQTVVIVSRILAASGPKDRLETSGIDADQEFHHSVFMSVFSDAGIDDELSAALDESEADPPAESVCD